MVVNQLKVHPFQSYGFRYVNLHPYIKVVVEGDKCINYECNSTSHRFMHNAILDFCGEVQSAALGVDVKAVQEEQQTKVRAAQVETETHTHTHTQWQQH